MATASNMLWEVIDVAYHKGHVRLMCTCDDVDWHVGINIQPTNANIRSGDRVLLSHNVVHWIPSCGDGMVHDLKFRRIGIFSKRSGGNS